MAARVDVGDGELASSSFWLPSPIVQVNIAPSASRSNCGTSSGSRALRPGDWRRAVAAETGGELLEDPADKGRYAEYTPNIDDVHSPASVNFDNGAGLLLDSPLLPRALTVSSGRGLGGAMGYMAASPQLDSPSSAISLSEGEASFRLESPVLDVSPSNLSPVRHRRGMPVDSELSTPGSDGYASPHVVFGPVHPSSLLRSSVQNPLYVDRPTPSETDNVAKALVLSPCADRSTTSRRHRCTFESGWSSSSPSAERSISLNPSQREERSSPLTVSQVTPKPSPAVSSARQLLSLVPLGDIDTPRRIIKSLSMSHEAAHLGLPRVRQASTPCATPVDAVGLPDGSLQRGIGSLAGTTSAATPCSVAVLENADNVPVSPGRTTASEPRTPVGKVSLLQPGTSKIVDSGIGTGNHSSDLDDTAVVDRVLDQTPRKAVKPVLQSCDQRQSASGQVRAAVPPDQTMSPKRAQQPALHPELASPAAPAGGRGGGIFRTVAYWTFLVLVASLLGNRVANHERWNHAPRPGVTPVSGFGPACLREFYPGEHVLLASKTCPWIEADAPPSWPAGLVQDYVCWLQLPTCRTLEGLFLQTTGSSPSAHANLNESGPRQVSAETSADVSDAMEDHLPVVCSVETAPGGVMQDGNTEILLMENYTVTPSVLATAWGNVLPPGRDNNSDALLSSFDSNGGSGLEICRATDEVAPATHTASALQSGNDVDDSGPDCASAVGPGGLDLPRLAPEDLYQDESELLAGFPDALGASDGGPLLQIMEDNSVLASSVDGAEDHLSSPGTEQQLPDNSIRGVDELIAGVSSQWMEDNGAESSATAAWVEADETEYAVAHLPVTQVTMSIKDQSVTVAVTEQSVENTVVELYDKISISEQSAELTVSERSKASGWLLSARLYGWNLPEFLLGAVAACLAGSLLAWTIESLRPHVQRRQPTRESRSGDVAQVVSPPTTRSGGRILRPKWPQGTTQLDHVVAEKQALPEDSGALLNQGTGSIVWTGNKLVYFEG